MLHSLRDFDKNEVAQQRMKIIKFYEEYGEKATVEAFGADRKVVSRWKKKLKEGGGRLLALIPESTRPHKKRTPDMPQEIVDYIKNIRLEHPKLGKEKIKPLLDKYLKDKGVMSILMCKFFQRVILPVDI